MDYYAVLELTASAQDQDIKKAYRKLAMRWHPDKNRDNALEAQHKFQEISEAYDVLIDPQKRAMFDQFGYEGLKNGVVDENGNASDGYAFNGKASEEVFTKFFGTFNPFYDFGFNDTLPFASALRKNNANPSEPIRRDIECTLEDLFYGANKSILVQRTRLVNDELKEDPKTFQISVKAGWKHGTKITYEHEGNESRSMEAGHVIFEIKELKHAVFVRDGSNLVYTAKLRLAQALGEHCIEIPTIDKRKLPIPCNEVICPSTEKMIKGEGMSILHSNGKRGDLILRFDILFPKHLTMLQKTALAKILS